MAPKAAKLAIRKRSFLLFELMVSLILIALCLFPLIKPLVKMRNAQLHDLISIQLEQINQNAFCDLKEQLYEQSAKLSLEELQKNTHGRLEQLFFVHTGKNRTLPFICEYDSEVLDGTNKISQEIKAIVIRYAFTFISPRKEVYGPYNHTLYLEEHQSGAT